MKTPTIFDEENINNSKQTGGATPTSKNLIVKALVKSKIKNLSSLLDFYKSDFFLKIIGLMMDKELFTELSTVVFKVNVNLLLERFFIEIENKSHLVSYIKANYTEINIENVITRDTDFVKMYTPNSKKVIFTSTLIEILNNLEVDSFGMNPDIMADFVNIYNEMSEEFEILKKVYDNFYHQNNNINGIYQRLVNKNKKVFSYIRERTDSSVRNPRYQNIQRTNNLLFFKPYYNVDGNYVGTQPEKLEAIKNNQNTIEEEYYMGPFDGVFLSTDNLDNKKISKQIKNDLFDKLINKKEDICIIGYGQSGSGKTSTLIYFEKEKEDGIIVELCKTKEFKSNFLSIELSMTNIYTYHGTDVKNTKSQEKKHYKKTNIKIDDSTKLNFIKDSKLGWIYENDKLKDEKRGIGQFINEAFSKREIEPTSNNPESSRSHVIVCLNLFINGGGSVKLVICDLAGVENIFNCDSKEEIFKFSKNYASSLEYGDKNEVELDKYFCKQGDVTNIANNIKNHEFNIMRDNISKDISKKNNKIDELSFIQSGGKCREPSKLNIKCPNDFVFWHIHEGNLNNPDWITAKNQIYEKLKYVFLSKKLLKIYIKILKNEKITDDDKSKYLDIASNEENFKKIYGKSYLSLDNFKIGTTKLSDFFSKEFNKKKLNQFLNHSNSKTKVEINRSKLRNFITNLDEDLTQDYKIYKEQICEETRLKILEHNCQLRIHEGYAINKSLLEMRESIKQLIKRSLKLSNGHLPIFWDRMYYPYCRNIHLSDKLFAQFYENNSESNLDSIIFDVISDFGVEIDKLNFVIFTIINTSENQHTNNPPNPPYINISLLTYNLEINFNEIALKDELGKVVNRMKNYNFYQNNDNFKKYINDFEITTEKTKEQVILLTNKLIEIVNNNNPSTLIGSIESTEILQKLVYKSICSKNIVSEDLLDKYSKIKLPTLRSDNNYN